MSGPVRVAIGVIESAGHVLVGRRPQGGPLAGMAEFPGGKCVPDETTRGCVVRECREETGLLVVPRSHLVTTTRQYQHGLIELDFWQCGLSPDLPDLTAATDPFQWVPFSALRGLDFPSGNAEVLKLLNSVRGGCFVTEKIIGIIIVDHGSRRPESNRTLLLAARRFAETGPYEIVEPAHMELAQPDIATAFDRCVARGASHVIVFPYFLSPGRHWKDDIPQLVSSAAKAHPHVAWNVTAPFGLHDGMLQVISERISEVLNE